MSAPASITVTPVLVADLVAEGEPMPLCVHVIDHPDARVLVDTGMTELHPFAAELQPRLRPLSEQDFDLAGVDIVVNTHLHADHCGGNHLFAGRPFYVQRRELDDARSEDSYTVREWVEAPGVRYVPVDGELELLPGLRLVPAPGHTRGTQVVVVETGGRPVVVGGDVTARRTHAPLRVASHRHGPTEAPLARHAAVSRPPASDEKRQCDAARVIRAPAVPLSDPLTAHTNDSVCALLSAQHAAHWHRSRAAQRATRSPPTVAGGPAAVCVRIIGARPQRPLVRPQGECRSRDGARRA